VSKIFLAQKRQPKRTREKKKSDKEREEEYYGEKSMEKHTNELTRSSMSYKYRKSNQYRTVWHNFSQKVWFSGLN